MTVLMFKLEAQRGPELQFQGEFRGSRDAVIFLHPHLIIPGN
jgi:hypothetical protein